MLIHLPEGAQVLAASSLIVTPHTAWDALVLGLKGQVHAGDWWYPVEPEKGVSMPEVRQIQYFAGRTSVGEERVVCIPFADRLRVESANALLKLVEEPPKGLYVVMFAETADILPTLSSRIRTLRSGVDSAIMDSKGSHADSWKRALSSLDLRNAVEREKANRLLHAYPLVHTGIKPEPIIDSLS